MSRLAGIKRWTKRTYLAEKGDGYPIIPEKELKCVWMTAGLLSYKLCQVWDADVRNVLSIGNCRISLPNSFL